MSFNPTAYSTQQFETLNGSIAATAGSVIAPGVAVTLGSLPTSPIKLAIDQYYKVDIADDKASVFGVVSPSRTGAAPSITDSLAGRVVLMNSALIPVLLATNGTKGDKIKVKNTKGEWGPIAVGETPLAELLETEMAGKLAWARRL